MKFVTLTFFDIFALFRRHSLDCGRGGLLDGFLRGRIYFRRGWGWGGGRHRRRRGVCPGRGGRRGLASLRGLPLAESALRAAAAVRPTTGHFQRIFGEMFGGRHVRQQDAPRVFRDPHAMERNAHTTCCV